MKCPGQDSRYWKPGAVFEVKCPNCGKEVEFFKDDTTRKCTHCGHRFLNPSMDFGCAAYCTYAEQCIGNLPPELIAQKQDMLKDRVAIELKRYLKRDFRRIGHATRVARYAERIGREEQGDIAVILIAAYLHDFGRLDVESEQHHAATGASLEEEGPAVARELLARAGAGEELTQEVCHILERDHSPGPKEDINFRSVHDAHMIALLEEGQKEHLWQREKIARIIEDSFLTHSGRRLAKTILLKES
jgi:hypothetical protein